MAGTREDATLMVEIAKWGAMIGLGEASQVIYDDAFDPDSASALDGAVQTTLIFYETIGTLVKNDLFDRDLVNDWLYSKGAWDKVAPAARRAREASGVPQMFENFEALAARQG